MELDYFKIGQRIRKYRKAYNLSQEQLADKVGISVSHASHIENGGTKLSLPVLFICGLSKINSSVGTASSLAIFTSTGKLNLLVAVSIWLI